jgi:Flp pilus assembly protein TadG
MRQVLLRRSSAPGRRDEGAVAVEFVLVVPLFLLVIFGLIAFGLYLSSTLNAHHAAREAARLAAVGVDDCATWEAQVRDRATGVALQPGGISLAYSPGSGGDPSVTDVGDEIQVELDLNNSAASGVFSAATAFFGDGDGLPDFTVTARSRAEQIGDVTSCSA